MTAQRADAALGGEGVREVGLEHDPRLRSFEARAVERLEEGLDGDLEVAVLLHVEVDELRDAGTVGACEALLRGRANQQLEAIAEPAEGRLAGHGHSALSPATPTARETVA